MIDKIFNEDCLEGMKKIPDGIVDFVLTDLPFGITQNEWDKKIDLTKFWEQVNRVTKWWGAMAFHCQQPFTSELIISNRKNFRYCWTWYKKQVSGFLNARKQPLRNCEDIAIFYRQQCTYNPIMRKGKLYAQISNSHTSNYGKFAPLLRKSDLYYPTTLLEVPLPRYKGGHPTQKPIKLLEYLIKTYTNEGEIVLDATIGSGSTAVAAINTGRHFIGFETEKKFFDIANERIAKAQAEVAQRLF